MHGLSTITSLLLLLLPLITLSTANPVVVQQSSSSVSVAPVHTSGPSRAGAPGYTGPKAIKNKRKDTDPEEETLPAPIPDPSYADWMSNLYDMGSGSSRGGKKERRRSEKSGGRRGRRDDATRYKTSVTAEEIDEWRMQAAGEGAVWRYIGDLDYDD